MARIRKSARTWRDAGARSLADATLYAGRDGLFALEPASLFSRRAPLEVEIGSGRGDFILARAAAMPNHDFLALELSGSVSRLLALRVARSELGNLKVVRADARTVVNLLLPDASVHTLHIYFPDPWPKDRHAKHRLFSPFFVSSIERVLARDGTLFVATDVRPYAERIFAMLAEAGFAQTSRTAPGELTSGFGRKYAASGKELFAASLVPPGG